MMSLSTLRRTTVIKTNNGYDSGFETRVNVLNPEIKWQGPGITYWETISFPDKTCSTVATVKLEKFNSDLQKAFAKDYEN